MLGSITYDPSKRWIKANMNFKKGKAFTFVVILFLEQPEKQRKGFFLSQQRLNKHRCRGEITKTQMPQKDRAEEE